MASPGGNTGGAFDVNKLFKPSSGPLTMIPPPPSPLQQQQQQQQQAIPPPSPTASSSNNNNPVGIGVGVGVGVGGGGGGNLTTSPSFPLPSSAPLPYIAPSSSYPPPTGPYHNPYHPHYLSPYPPPPPPQLHNQYLTTIPHQHQHQPQPQPQNRPQPISSYPAPPPPLSPNNTNPGGAVLMDILTNQNQQQQQQQQLPMAVPFPAPSSSSGGSGPVPSAPPVSLSSPTQQQQHGPAPMRMLSSKLPKGRHLIGGHVVYDIDVRLQGEVQPQLEVTPITKYVSDPGLVLGRQIAVNRTYICYGLKPGAIRILNINTALRSLLRGHNQKVTDMAFFAEDVHLLASTCIDGRVFIRKISEGPDEEDKPQIFERIILALHIISEGESVHPRLCWHPHKQEILVVAIGNCILKIDTIRVGKGESFSAEEPLKCSTDKLIDGVQLVGKHEGEVTELSMCQWMTTRLASASTDGTVKIWEDRKAVPLAILRPHDGKPVNSVAFLTAAHRPDHIVLISGGPLNQEVKIWASASEEGWLLPSDAESWHCAQTLTLKCSAESSVENAFFNQVIALPRAGLLLLANAKKNAIYAVHIEYGSYPSATHMDYIAEFTVTMPILSLTGTSDSLPNGEHIVQVYCVQTQAIQQYALNLSQCLPPPLQNMELERTDSNVSRTFDSDGSASFESSHRTKPSEMSVDEGAPLASQSEGFAASEVTTLPDSAPSGLESKASALSLHNHAENINAVSTPLPLSPRLSQKLSDIRNPSNSTELGTQHTDHSADQPALDYMVDHKLENVKQNTVDASNSGDSSKKGEKTIVQTDISMAPEPPVMFKHPTHLITPSEILSRAVSSTDISQTSQGMNVEEAKVQDLIIKNETESAEVEVKVIGETGINQNNHFDLPRESQITIGEKKEKSFYSQASDLSIQMARDCCMESHSAGAVRQVNEDNVPEIANRLSNCGEDGGQEKTKDVPPKVDESENHVAVPQSAQATKGKKQKGKNSQLSVPSSPLPSPFNSTDSSNEPGCSSGAQSSDATLFQLSAMQDMLDQVMSMQKEMQKQMNTIISVPVSKEGKRLEASLGRSIEKVVKANTDALWARFQDENSKHDKLERDRTQQLTNLIANCMNKDLPSALEKTLKKEIAAIGTSVARAITPTLEKSISSAIAESFQKGVSEKAVSQLEKSVGAKLEATVSRQFQSQFQTSGKQALQDALRSSLETSVIPAFEMSCKAMFDQVDATLQKGLVNHTNAAQQQFDSAYSPLAIALRDAMNSASSITRTLSGELADSQRKLLAIANSKVGNTSAAISNGPLTGLHEMAEVPMDPTKELSRLIAEHKYEEAFTAALHRSDVSIVSWLCSQVDLQGMLNMQPLPLSQGVLLALLQQLACDIVKETPRKIAWMTDVAVAIIPTDPMIAMHVRPIFDQVSQILTHHRSLPTTSAAEANNIRLLMFVINSVLMSCK